MNIKKQEINGSLVVFLLEKRLDASVAGNFKEYMASAISEGNRKIVLDLSQVAFIDSSGLGSIVSALKLLGKKGVLAVAGTQNTVLNMFKLTRMNRVFRMFNTYEEALESFS